MTTVRMPDRPQMPFGQLAMFARDRSLTALVGYEEIVRLLLAEDSDHSDEYYMLLEIVVDTFHDFFTLDSVQRKTVTRAIKDNRMDVKAIFEMLRSDDEPFAQTSGRPLGPAVTESSATGLSGPYPTSANLRGTLAKEEHARGRSPSVKSLLLPDAHATGQPTALDGPSSPERHRPTSAPPTGPRGWSLGWKGETRPTPEIAALPGQATMPAPAPAPAPAPSADPIAQGINDFAKRYSDYAAGKRQHPMLEPAAQHCDARYLHPP